LANAVVAALLGTLAPPVGTRGVIINFLKSSFVIGCSDLKQQLHLCTSAGKTPYTTQQPTMRTLIYL